MAPRKRKDISAEARQAAAPLPIKKRKTTATDTDAYDHSKCTKHTDAEQRKTRCNGIRGDGTRCPTKIKASASEEALNQGLLPVCGVHKKQVTRIGRCVAKADCGENCDRLVLVRPELNQLRKAHANVSLSFNHCRLRMKHISLNID